MIRATVSLAVGEDHRPPLREALEHRYRVVEGEPKPDDDLCIADRSGIVNHHETLEARTETEQPAFYPVVLFRKQRSGDRSSEENGLLAADDASAPLIDEAVEAPVKPAVLQRRLGNLLTRRGHTYSLARHRARQESHLESLVEFVPEPAFVLAEDGGIDRTNARFRRLVGGERDDLYGRALGTVLDCGCEDGTVWRDRLADGRNSNQPVQFTDKAGRERYAKLSVERLHTDGRERVAGVLSDVTAIYETVERFGQ